MSFVFGIVRGLIFGGLIAAGVSVYFGSIKTNTPKASPVSVPSGSGFDGVREDAQIAIPREQDPNVQTSNSPKVSEPEVHSDVNSPATDVPLDQTTAPTPDPVAPVADLTPDEANIVAVAPLEAPQTSETAPTLPTPPMQMPQAPKPEGVGSVSTTPVQPTITDEAPALPESTPSAPVDDQKEETDLGEVDQSVPALIRNSVDRVETDDKPMLSIVVLDAATGPPMESAAVQALPFPVSFAVDIVAENATQRIAHYLENNVEVIASLSLPSGATPQDIEANITSLTPVLDHTVALMELEEGGLQPSRDGSTHLIDLVAASGHGLILYEQGLNTGLKYGQKRNLPVNTVYRDLDGEGQDGRAIRRFLDGAAFRAAQENGVIVVARSTPDTLSALLLWALQDRAKSVALVPISQVLQAQIQ